jgi:hypothetical protein
MGEWQDISTAPKDGTGIRIAWGGPDNWTTADAMWRDGEWIAAATFYNPQYTKPPMSYGESVVAKPTHWQPLPAPPEPSP